MSHQGQLSPAASHRPTAVLDPAGHAAEPPACRSRCPYSPGRTGHVPDTFPPLEIRSAQASFTPPPKIPGQAREPAARTNPPGPATIPRSVRWQTHFPRRGKRLSNEEGSDPRTPRAPGVPHYIPGHPGSDLPARLMTVIDPRDAAGLMIPRTSREQWGRRSPRPARATAVCVPRLGRDAAGTGASRDRDRRRQDDRGVCHRLPNAYGRVSSPSGDQTVVGSTRPVAGSRL